MFQMKILHDKPIDAVYIQFSDKSYAYGKDLDEERRIDYDVNGDVRGVELHCISRGVDLEGLPKTKEIESVLRDIGIKEYAC